MAGLKSLVCLAFLGSIGMTLLILACALPGIWWPFFVLIFYVLTPIPTMLAQRHAERSGNSSGSFMDAAIFITMGFVVSAFGLPIILTRSPAAVISLTACYLTLSANVVIFITLLGFFMIFQEDDNTWWQI